MAFTKYVKTMSLAPCAILLCSPYFVELTKFFFVVGCGSDFTIASQNNEFILNNVFSDTLWQMCSIAFKPVSLGILYLFFMRLSILVLNYMQIFFTYVYLLLLCTWCFFSFLGSVLQSLILYRSTFKCLSNPFGCELRTWGLFFFGLGSFVYIVNIRFLITIQLLNILYIYTYMYNEYVVKLGFSVFTSIYMYCICMYVYACNVLYSLSQM